MSLYEFYHLQSESVQRIKLKRFFILNVAVLLLNENFGRHNDANDLLGAKTADTATLRRENPILIEAIHRVLAASPFS